MIEVIFTSTLPYCIRSRSSEGFFCLLTRKIIDQDLCNFEFLSIARECMSTVRMFLWALPVHLVQDGLDALLRKDGKAWDLIIDGLGISAIGLQALHTVRQLVLRIRAIVYVVVELLQA